MRRLHVALLGAAALPLLAPVSARAAAFFIDDTLPTEQIRFTANDFEQGLSINGTLFQQGTNNQQSALFPEADAVGNPIVYNFQGNWISGTFAQPPVQVAFIEPGTGALSDVLFVQYDGGSTLGHITGHFVSDTNEQGLDPAIYLTPGVPVTNWPETNGAFNFSAPFLSASANSDVEIPEPASLGLIAVGAGALIRRRRPA